MRIWFFFFFGWCACVRVGRMGIILPAFALQLAHKLILNSRFGIPQLGVFVRNNLTPTPIHSPEYELRLRMCGMWCLGVGWNELAKARRRLNYSKLYHPNEMKHSALVLCCREENKWVFFFPLFVPSLRNISIEQKSCMSSKIVKQTEFVWNPNVQHWTEPAGEDSYIISVSVSHGFCGRFLVGALLNIYERLPLSLDNTPSKHPWWARWC